jgi:hypothetical protein
VASVQSAAAEAEWIEQEPLRAEVLRAFLGADEFVRRCTSGTHRVYAVAVVLFEPGGRVVNADIDTGDAAANECARRLLSALRVERFRAPSFAVAFPFRVYSNKEDRVREVTAGIEPQMTFAPELCLWGASGDPRCRDEREANAVDCAADRR